MLKDEHASQHDNLMAIRYCQLRLKSLCHQDLQKQAR